MNKKTNADDIPSSPIGGEGRVRGQGDSMSNDLEKVTSTPHLNPLPSEGRGRGTFRNRTTAAREVARRLRQRFTDPRQGNRRTRTRNRTQPTYLLPHCGCGSYFLDFYCPVAKLAVGLDGGGHGFPDRRARDEKRNEFLNQRGIKILRFWNHQLRGELEAIRFEIWYALMERTGRREEIAGYLPKPPQLLLPDQGRGSPHHEEPLSQ